jgi:hypothetical protein
VQRVSAEGFVEDSIRSSGRGKSGTHALTKRWEGSEEQTRRRIVQLLRSAGIHEVDTELAVRDSLQGRQTTSGGAIPTLTTKAIATFRTPTQDESQGH